MEGLRDEVQFYYLKGQSNLSMGKGLWADAHDPLRRFLQSRITHDSLCESDFCFIKAELM